MIINLQGQIPSCIENLVNLQVFYGGGNSLSGIIPQGIGKLLQLSSLDLGTNRLSGSIPSSIGNLTQLTILDLSENNLQGNITSALGNCKNLLALSLSQNNLICNIPTQLFGLTMLFIQLGLSQNRLSGSLPPEVGQLTNLGTLDLSYNVLSGELPSTLGACLSMDNLYLEGNLFKGAIPDALQTLKGLGVLDLSHNNFSGKIPKFLGSLQLQMLNLSYNNLESMVPTEGVFNNAALVSVVGNSKLCVGRPEQKLPNCNSENINQVRKPGHRKIVILTILFSFLGVILLFVTLALFYAFRCTKKKGNEASDNSDKFLNLSYHSLLEATNGFSAENIIGSGGHGVVYKGTLIPDARMVAIKVFKLDNHGASNSFMVECGVLRNIRHRHLVKVITACSSIDYQGNDFKALIYEYMENGSLEEWLHPDEEVGCAPKTLNFHHGLDIAVDIAFALEYLHHHCETSLVHCDLKPSNVLLDCEMVAHVSDFGLAKFLSESTSSDIIENHSSSVRVRGTIGYTPPEYGAGNEVSTNGDVYCFGVLIQEMFTGKRPTDDMFKEGLTLSQFVKQALPNHVTQILERDVLPDIIEEQSQQTHNSNPKTEALICILEIALSCTGELPRQRSDMREVAAKLSSIKTKLNSTRSISVISSIPQLS